MPVRYVLLPHHVDIGILLFESTFEFSFRLFLQFIRIDVTLSILPFELTPSFIFSDLPGYRLLCLGRRMDHLHVLPLLVYVNT